MVRAAITSLWSPKIDSAWVATGAAYGGLVGGAADVARFALLHLNHGTVDGTRLMSPAATEAMQRITPRGVPLDFGLGWFRRHDGRPPAYVEHLGGGSGSSTSCACTPGGAWGSR